MKTRILAIGFSAMLVGPLLYAQQQGNELPMAWFNRMDRNGDGKLSREEVPSPRFQDLDNDSDGFAGYDGPYADNRSAWICRATFSEEEKR